MIDDEEKVSHVILKWIGKIIIVLLIAIVMILFTIMFYLTFIAPIQIGNDHILVSYKITEEKLTLNVNEVQSFSEFDKGLIYSVTCSDSINQSYFFEFDEELYNQIIGTEYNRFSTTRYKLVLIVENIGEFKLNRYSIYGENAFSEDEVMEIVESLLEKDTITISVIDKLKQYSRYVLEYEIPFSKLVKLDNMYLESDTLERCHKKHLYSLFGF